MNSVDSSYAGWAAGAGGAAEAYAESQEIEAAQARADQQAKIDSGALPPNDGVEPPASTPAQDSFWSHDPNRPLPGTDRPPAFDQPGPNYVTPGEAQLLQQAGITVNKDDEGRFYVPAQGGNDVIGPAGPWAPLAGPSSSSANAGPSANEAGPREAPSEVGGTNLPGGVSTANDAGAAGEPDEIHAGLGAEVDDTINRSPTLRRLWDQARAEGWQIQIVRNDARSNANPKTHLITLNLNNIKEGGDQAAKLTSALAHEIGHAVHGPHWRIESDSKDEYIAKNTADTLQGEGEAAFENARARDEILSHGGRDIGIRGGLDPEYIGIYEDYKAGRISEGEAISRMGHVQGREPETFDGQGNVTSNRKQGFESYFAKEFDDDQRKRAASGQSGG